MMNKKPEIRTYLTQADYNRLFAMVEREHALLSAYSDEGFAMTRPIKSLLSMKRRLENTCCEDG